MARARSDEKRRAILEAATTVIVAQGLSAPTAGIAKKAGVVNGSFFTYFKTKADLLNQLYLELKREMVSAAMKNFPEKGALCDQAHHVWRNWMNYARPFPVSGVLLHSSVFLKRLHLRLVLPQPRLWRVLSSKRSGCVPTAPRAMLL